MSFRRPRALHAPIQLPHSLFLVIFENGTRRCGHRFLSSLVNDRPVSRLNPTPNDFAAASFADRAQLTLHAGRGGNGCVSFLREAYLAEGPANGGDGGAGGNIYIQAVPGETSLHKLARKRFIRAGSGKHGQGSAKGGSRGEDVIITVPVGTVVREVDRQDPAAEEAMSISAWQLEQRRRKREKRLADEQKALNRGDDEVEAEDPVPRMEEDDIELDDPQRKKWLLYPGMTKSEMRSSSFPRLPRRMRHLQQPSAPVFLDLSRPTQQPILLATGGIGGLGNPHFTSKDHPRPMFATKGEDAVTMRVTLELKLLADVGLVGLPNAGKSTLLRSLTNSRTRVGDWAFTTLQPNIGTVVLDKNSGRPIVSPRPKVEKQDGFPAGDSHGDSDDAAPRTRFSIADIPGLVEGAHLDRGLGIEFLRHVERARVLAFIIDLGAGDAVKALKGLWREVRLYAQMREEEEHDRLAAARVNWDTASPLDFSQGPVSLTKMVTPDEMPRTIVDGKHALHIAGKPWFVVATKADLPDTQKNFRRLKEYLLQIQKREVPHPSGAEDAWVRNCVAVPVSAINGKGVERIIHWTVGLLD